jgi:EmrB/QacA subfamily drug resistance transporter
VRPGHDEAVPTSQRRALRTRLGFLTLLLLATVQFIAVIDASIVNVALPSIQRSLHFSQQNLQWVVSGYLLTYGGFLLLGGRLGDLLGRRRMLVTGVIVFAVASLAGGLADSQGLLIGARLVQGMGGALMTPAALSALTTTFREGTDRNAALGVWGAVSGIAGAAGVFLGGVLSQGPGWRWVLFVNPPICLLVLAGALWLLPGKSGRERPAGFDVQGSVLVTAGMLLLVYALVRAPQVGWGTAQTVGMLAAAGVLLIAFVVNEARSRHPLVPFSILRVKGLAAADGTQLLAFAGIFAMLFFVTLYMQEILHYSPLKAGADYVPITVGFAIAGGISSQLITRIGTRTVIVAGALSAAAGIFDLSRVPVHGSYAADVLPGMLVMALGMGAVFVAATAAANAGVPPAQAGLAAGLLNASQQLGSALGLAVLSAIAISRTESLLAAHAARPEALTSGYHRGLLVGSMFMVAAAAIGLRTSNTRAAAQPVIAPAEAAPEPATASRRRAEDISKSTSLRATLVRRL